MTQQKKFNGAWMIGAFFTLATLSCGKKQAPAEAYHLKDSILVEGNAVVFLVPDSIRFDVLNADPESGAVEVDSDHGFAIQQTVDSIQRDAAFKGITITVTHARYIGFPDCANCAPWMDRDTINYGYLMTGPGRKPLMMLNMVHGGDYIQEIVDFYALDANAAFRKSTLDAMFRDASLFRITDTIFADLDGDRKTDRAYFAREGSRLQLVIDGARGKVTVGSDPSFKELGDDFSWASYWALTKDGALVVHRDEVGGGVVRFLNGKYVWEHQTD